MLHLRPSAFIAKIANSFPDTRILVTRASDPATEIDPKSILSLAIQQLEDGEQLRLQTTGPDEDLAATMMRIVFENLNGYADNPNEAKTRISELIDREFLPPSAHAPEREILYRDEVQPRREAESVTVTTVSDEIKRFFAKNPQKLYSITPRAFEELVAAILSDMGIDVELTKATRDGGIDIYAHVRNELCSFLLLVECKRYAAERPVGIEVVQRVYGIQQASRANKAMIITTSYFSKPAKDEAEAYQGLMDLKDYDDLKQWLLSYQ